ncbi:MAG: Crp/Fnr family transcriptional regulator [Anaerolineae bacterium]
MGGTGREEILQFLGRHPYFAGLDERALQRVADCVVVRRMARDNVIVMQGDPPAAVYFIAHGQVRISRLSPDGREQALMDLFPGQVFNLVAAIDGRPTPSTAIARTSVVLYVIHRSDFWHLLHTYPQVAEAVLVDFAARLRRFTALVEDLSLRTVAERLARLLLEMAGDPNQPTPRFTQQELASRLGTVREVVSRTLKRFEEQGLIQVERHRIVILDPEGLERIACAM